MKLLKMLKDSKYVLPVNAGEQPTLHVCYDTSTVQPSNQLLSKVLSCQFVKHVFVFVLLILLTAELKLFLSSLSA